jgi:hypothetical protein
VSGPELSGHQRSPPHDTAAALELWEQLVVPELLSRTEELELVADEGDGAAAANLPLGAYPPATAKRAAVGHCRAQKA